MEQCDRIPLLTLGLVCNLLGCTVHFKSANDDGAISQRAPQRMYEAE